MKKKVGALIISGILLLGFSGTVLASAKLLEAKNVKVAAVNQKDLNEAQFLLDQALKERTFYKYNLAYTAILKIGDQVYRDSLMNELAAIMDIVWSPDVKLFNSMLDRLVSTKGSGKIYDEMEAAVSKSTLHEEDKGYLLGELTSWGKRLVYTTDYADAVDKVVYAWIMLKNGTEQNISVAISEAQNAIKGVKNNYSRDYLTEQINQVKLQSEFSIIEIN